MTRLSQSIVYIFVLSVFATVDRPIPFILGFVFSICFGRRLLPFSSRSFHYLPFLLLNVLFGLLFVLGFDWIRISPRLFQLLLFSEREILIIIWSLSSAMLISYFHLMKTKLCSQGLGFVRWVLGSFSLLVVLNLPILRTMISYFGNDSLKIQFVVLVLMIAIISWRLSSGYLSVLLFSWQISTCWFFLCDSRFFAVITIFNLLLFCALLFDFPKVCKIIAYGSQTLLLLVAPVIFSLAPFFTPWIQKIHWLASLLYKSTSTRVFDTWSLNLWHQDYLDLGSHWPNRIVQLPELLIFSHGYRSSVLGAFKDPFYYANHAHSLPIQQLIAFFQSSGSVFDSLISILLFMLLLFFLGYALVYYFKGSRMSPLSEVVYCSTVLLGSIYISTESLAIRNAIPIVLLLPIIQILNAQPLSPSPSLPLVNNISFRILRSPVTLLLCVSAPVILYVMLYMFRLLS